MSKIFDDCTLYCTGTFRSHDKSELKAIVEDLGGIYAKGFNNSLSYLVVGSLKGSTKTSKALEKGIKILTEDEFLKMIGE